MRRYCAVSEFRGETTVIVKSDEIVAVCTFLKKDLGYNFLTDLCAIDYLGQAPRFMVVYQLYNIAHSPAPAHQGGR